jgi:hypothetical protein
MIKVNGGNVLIADLIAAHSERQLCGQNRLLLVQLLLAQHFLASAATDILQRSGFHQTSRSSVTLDGHFKSTFRCVLGELAGRGIFLHIELSNVRYHKEQCKQNANLKQSISCARNCVFSHPRNLMTDL